MMSHSVSSWLLSHHVPPCLILFHSLILSHPVSSCLIMSHHFSSYLILSYLISQCLIISHLLILSDPVSSYLTMSHTALPCLILSHPFPPRLILSQPVSPSFLLPCIFANIISVIYIVYSQSKLPSAHSVLTKGHPEIWTHTYVPCPPLPHFFNHIPQGVWISIPVIIARQVVKVVRDTDCLGTTRRA